MGPKNSNMTTLEGYTAGETVLLAAAYLYSKVKTTDHAAIAHHIGSSSAHSIGTCLSSVKRKPNPNTPPSSHSPSFGSGGDLRGNGGTSGTSTPRKGGGGPVGGVDKKAGKGGVRRGPRVANGSGVKKESGKCQRKKSESEEDGSGEEGVGSIFGAGAAVKEEKVDEEGDAEGDDSETDYV
ncbi:hypothetical protein K402DRAFT_239273 [Aulographum hederae CBS 113979]|uniref:Uncharacterized protein n=1 Tax=Aulographum hederae CBS 113979 TaxID=1176131 RepID=A0A6G1GK72_9PEZI|nr:hypothetical protein K402DRAFT_239273 [Aulographum hederae CBS 113979]